MLTSQILRLKWVCFSCLEAPLLKSWEGAVESPFEKFSSLLTKSLSVAKNHFESNSFFKFGNQDIFCEQFSEMVKMSKTE